MKQEPGSWMDEWGACKVCGGEIPHGHSNSCDVYKMGQTIYDLSCVCRAMINQLKSREGNEKIWQDAEKVLTKAQKSP